jgi:hypothetical protein
MALSRKELLALHLQMTDTARMLMARKNHDYSGGDKAEDCFLNFTRVERLGIASTEAGFLVRMTDKLSRLITYVQNGKFEVEDEGLKDTVIDLINYSVLLYAYMAVEKGDYTE